jgi:hypothetical protein
MSSPDENIRMRWEGVKSIVSAYEFRKALTTQKEKRIFDELYKEIRTQELKNSWDQVKTAISPSDFKSGLRTPLNRDLFDAIVREKVSRANNSAKVVKVSTLKSLMNGFKGTLKNKEKYVEQLPQEDEETLFSFFAKSPKFSGKMKTLFKRANEKPSRFAAPVSNAPPGYEKVSTLGDGDCMFYSIYYAWNPEQGTAKAQEAASALALRRIVSREANVDDMSVEAIKSDLEQSIRLASGTNAAELQGYLAQINTIIQSERSQAQKQADILPLYKEFVLKRVYWGGTRERDILNRYGQVNNKPYIWIFDAMRNISYRIDPFTGQYIPQGYPIHYNGYNHYSILRAIDTSEGAQQRTDLEAAFAAQYAPTPEEIARGLRADKRGRLSILIRDFLESKGIEKAKRNSLALEIGNKYSGLQNLNSTANEATSKALSVDLPPEQAEELATLVRAKILELQGGKRKTRKQRKTIKKRYTRRH